ncbi:MAG: hypothetical protein ACPGO3_03455 [Magnetospiraceae bacterium]
MANAPNNGLQQIADRKALSRRIRGRVHGWIAQMVGTKVAIQRLRQLTHDQFTRNYGDFHLDYDCRGDAVKGLQNESGQIYGYVAVALRSLPTPPSALLLAGEGARAKPLYAGIAGIGEEVVTTAGLHDDADVHWNFEHQPPESLQGQACVISHAIIEHLIDPFGHLRDLIGLLAPGGHLIVHTAMPGFPYHRYPVDCFRFYPDWFEEVADRFHLTVRDKYIGDEQIVYVLARKQD